VSLRREMTVPLRIWPIIWPSVWLSSSCTGAVGALGAAEESCGVAIDVIATDLTHRA
jgi:hypothetical protein